MPLTALPLLLVKTAWYALPLPIYLQYSTPTSSDWKPMVTSKTLPSWPLPILSPWMLTRKTVFVFILTRAVIGLSQTGKLLLLYPNLYLGNVSKDRLILLLAPTTCGTVLQRTMTMQFKFGVLTRTARFLPCPSPSIALHLALPITSGHPALMWASMAGWPSSSLL